MPTSPSSGSKATTVIARGLAASPGRLLGRVVFDTHEALDRAKSGEDVILVKKQTVAADVPAMMVSKGIVTLLGGLTCHAAIVSRDLKKACIVGCSALRLSAPLLRVDSKGQTIEILEGDEIVIDGTTGEISVRVE